MGRRPILAALAALALLIPGGCATLPTSGEPHDFAIEAPQREPLRQYGSAPQEGSTPEELVDDFIRAASAGVYDDFATARLYLTAEAAASWEPGAQVIIFPAGTPPTTEADQQGDSNATVVMNVETIGSVDESGVLSVASPAGKTNVSFTLEMDEDGEWRISELQNGLILSQPSFLSAYQAVNLYFPSADLQALVPDPRWYPRTRVASHLVQGLIEGPTEQLAPAVDASITENLTLPTSSVDVKDRLATVALEGEVGALSTEKAALLWSIDATLKQLPAVQTVTVKVNGVEVSEALPSGPDYRLDRLAGLDDGAVVMGSSTVTSVVAEPSVAGAGAGNPTVGPLASSPVAWRDSSGRIGISSSIVATPEAVRFEEVTSPGAPSVDRFGNVWVSSDATPDVVYVFTPDGEKQAIDLSLTGALRRVLISPDGARAAMLVDSAGSTQVLVAAVYQDPVTGQYSLEEAEVMNQFSDQVLDLTWVGETTLAGLAEKSGQDPVVEIQDLGGWIETIAAPADTVRITASSIVGSMIVQRVDGVAFQRAGAAWIELASSLEQVSYAG